jgi:hypothetical protein
MPLMLVLPPSARPAAWTMERLFTLGDGSPEKFQSNGPVWLKNHVSGIRMPGARSLPPASRSRMCAPVLSARRCATTAPAAPEPIKMKS